MTLFNNIKKNPSIIVFADQAIFSGTNFLLTFLLARLFSVTDFGIYSYALLVAFLFLSITNAIIIQPFQILVSKKPQEEALGFIIKLLAVFIAVYLTLTTLCNYTTAVLKLPTFLMKPTSMIHQNFTGILIFVLGYVFQDFFRKSLLAIQKINWVLWIDVLFILVFPVLAFSPFSLSETLCIIGVFNIISSIPGLVFFIKNAKYRFANQSYLKYHLQQGKWLLSTSILQWFSSNFLVFVSGIYLGLEVLGALRLVQSFFGVLNVILQTIENSFLPKTAQLYYKNAQEAKQYLSKITKEGALIFGSFLFLLFVFSDQIIIILGGEKYQGFGYVVKLMVFLYVFIFYGYPVRIGIRILELNQVFFYGYIISFVFSVLSFHFLLKYTALYGAILGLIISQILMIFYWKYELRKNKFILWK